MGDVGQGGLVRRLVVAIGVAALLSGCGGGAPGGGGVAPGDDGVGAEVLLPRCEDLTEVAPRPQDIADSPVYVGNEQPVDAVRAWASARPGFADLWIDRDANGWVVVGFTEGVDEARAAAAARFPEEGVAVVDVPYTLSELTAVQEELGSLEAPVAGTAADVRRGVVVLDLVPLSDEVHVELSRALAGQPVCVAGPPVEDVPSPGPQPTAGDGWRLLVAQRGPSLELSNGIATTADQLDELVARAGVGVAVDGVDLSEEVVVLWAVDHGSSCPSRRLDDVQLVSGSGRVPRLQPVIVDPDAPAACTADLTGTWVFVVAVARDLLPAGPFDLDAARPDTPGTVGRVDADLSRPGTTIGPDALRPPREPDRRVRTGDIVETGHSASFAFPIACSAEVLGELNDVVWVATAEDLGPGGVPEAWRDVVEEDGTVTVDVLVEGGDPPTLTATANGVAVVYEPGDAAVCG